jgi:hypothetical protein
MSKASPYQHAKLPSSTDQVRLLIVDLDGPSFSIGDQPPASLWYTFHIVPVTEAPSFIALSYEWGSPEDTEEIFIDGSPMTIRRNLLQALNQIEKQKPVLLAKIVRYYLSSC